jgi:cytochrome c oxidase subunit II
MQQIPAAFWTLLIGIVVTLFSFWYGQNNHLLPLAASEAAPLVDQLFNVMVTIGTALFILVQGAIIYAMIRFRKPKGDETDGSSNDGNIPLEILWTAIPAVIVIGLGIYSVEVYQEMGGFTAGSAGMMAHGHHHSKATTVATQTAPAVGHTEHASMMGSAIAAPAPPIDPNLIATTYGIGEPGDNPSMTPDVSINVTGMQFAWLFEYPTAGVTMGELHVPVGQRVKLQMKAVDVLHALWIPQFRIKQDVMPGLDSELQFVATKAGTYPVFCAELCGSYHGSMRTQIVVETPEEFAKWLEDSRVAQALDPAKTIAQVPAESIPVADRSVSEFLQPYATEIGLDAPTLSNLQPSQLTAQPSKVELSATSKHS